MNDIIPIRRALVSVSDKSRLIELGQALAARGVVILSTGGSAKNLRDAGIAVTEVADYTGFPEMLDGRVKTLHPRVHGGLLGVRDDATHRAAMDAHGIEPIDLVVINLYPFEATVEKGASFEVCIENIDIGGPAMIRSAAKNHQAVTVVTDVADYDDLLDELADQEGGTTLALRRRLAAAAFARTAAYDAAIATWFAQQTDQLFPQRQTLSASLSGVLRYGENPHQKAALYRNPADPRPGIATARQLQGKELSYNNLNDTDAAFLLVSELSHTEPAVAIIKHANPCGVAMGRTMHEAYLKALSCDPVSAFGGIVALNHRLDAETASEIVKVFTEVVIAPAISDEARNILASKKNVRLLLSEGLIDPKQPMMTWRQISGGFLLQDHDRGMITAKDLKVVTKRAPTDAEIDDLLFAFTVAKHVKSNAIVYARNGMTVGIGAGQMNRRDSSRIAAIRAAEAAEAAGDQETWAAGSVVASDAFFPFADGLLAAAEAGATAVIQPGGSMRDDEVIKAADEAGLAMVLTGMRHFRH
ncbi:bifunctional purine biosynthesis protein PurH [Iodidimonas nitroreducens]|uniref:Bifunctional purine biosynthesis protein PurH n=1 Tax=Iodidimonas nitroreducens TaxID=1236968 RepID=A0A5A7N257_9PROT|nr:bifunctional phosphoribosylaminoimidazolecarboxamide formyltransferase/IMP cyclohydrolase [Iodidimonas nitroreducens]GAK34894.1 bifunctional purine biosynthesis protein PurH [alpha proteobacterium Q-1]GER02363.1 bifunctional purine biosynthesis protein PurH [Iodidimonas nitroreducens]